MHSNFINHDIKFFQGANILSTMPVDSKEPSTASPTPDDTAIVMYTSGSTGTPKVVNAQSNIMNISWLSYRRVNL